MGKRPPFETFTGPTCRGSYALGTACGHCEKCAWERSLASDPTMPESPTPDIGAEIVRDLLGFRDESLKSRDAEPIGRIRSYYDGEAVGYAVSSERVRRALPGKVVVPVERYQQLLDMLDELRREATTLHNSASGCAVNHYGEDYSIHGMPGWLSDAEKVIERAQALHRAMTTPCVDGQGNRKADGGGE